MWSGNHHSARHPAPGVPKKIKPKIINFKLKKLQLISPQIFYNF